MVIAFITCISNSGDVNQPKMGTRKVKAMVSVPRCYERVAKADKHQSPDALDHKVNNIGWCEIYRSADTCCVKNWRLLSTTDQLCDIKVFHN